MTIDRTGLVACLVVLSLTVGVTSYVGLTTTQEDWEEANQDIETVAEPPPWQPFAAALGVGFTVVLVAPLRTKALKLLKLIDPGFDELEDADDC